MAREKPWVARETVWHGVDDIEVDARHREVTDEAVDNMAEWFTKDGGMKTPITVRRVEQDDKPVEIDRVILVTGATRLAAAKKLGWDKIECFQDYAITERQAEMWEIAENLHRTDLTTLERSDQITRWLELAEEERQGVSGQFDPKLSSRGRKSEGRPEGGTSAAARGLKFDSNTAKRSKRIAGLSPEAKSAAKEVGLDDNQSALLDAAKETEADAQVIFLKSEAERREAERLRKEAEKHNRNQDRVIEITEAEKFAAWLDERVTNSELPTLISWLEGTKPKEVIAALRRLSGPSIDDIPAFLR